jgi:hypothetical protein
MAYVSEKMTEVVLRNPRTGAWDIRMDVPEDVLRAATQVELWMSINNVFTLGGLRLTQNIFDRAIWGDEEMDDGLD